MIKLVCQDRLDRVEVACEPIAVPLPTPPPLLLAVSESVVPRPGYWPESVQLVGFLSSQQSEASRVSRQFVVQPPTAIVQIERKCWCFLLPASMRQAKPNAMSLRLRRLSME